MKKLIMIVLLVLLFILPLAVSAVETAPRINDREIVEKLTRLEEGQKHLEKRMDDLRAEMNSRSNTLEWMLGIFITISLVILGFVLRMQWQMQKRLTTAETVLSVHSDELSFLKNLIEKLLPPRGVL
ncbi:MAG: hypothetical protein Q8O55_13440 [Dehalococcoidales bacterium]|nr:hypothetical protein [Dehalococcoidales bacterium]